MQNLLERDEKTVEAAEEETKNTVKRTIDV